MSICKPILLIESNDDDVNVIKIALNDIHVTNRLERKTNIDEAYKYLRDERHPKPCMILLDFNMPGMDASEFIKTLQADHDLKRLPIVILVSSESDADAARSLGLEVAAYIIKPFDYTQFIEAMRMLDINWSLSSRENSE